MERLTRQQWEAIQRAVTEVLGEASSLHRTAHGGAYCVALVVPERMRGENAAYQIRDVLKEHLGEDNLPDEGLRITAGHLIQTPEPASNRDPRGTVRSYRHVA